MFVRDATRRGTFASAGAAATPTVALTSSRLGAAGALTAALKSGAGNATACGISATIKSQAKKSTVWCVSAAGLSARLSCASAKSTEATVSTVLTRSGTLRVRDVTCLK